MGVFLKFYCKYKFYTIEEKFLSCTQLNAHASYLFAAHTHKIHAHDLYTYCVQSNTMNSKLSVWMNSNMPTDALKVVSSKN